MKLPCRFHTGKQEMPAVLLIHGLNMNNYFWLDPERCYVLGGLAPLTVFLADEVQKPDNTISFGAVESHTRGLWKSLADEGYSIASWTQSQPLGSVHIAIEELKTVLETVRNKWPGKIIYLIGHSRGGLIARQFLLQENAACIAGLITICTPHSGSGMAKFSRYLKPAGVLLERVIPDKSKATLTKALNRLSEFFQSPAIAELEPGSEFMASIQKALPEKIRTLSFGGTSPALFHITVRLPGGSYKVIRFPDLLAGIVPSGHVPRELTPGFGDALVSAESAKISGGRHYDFPVNHVKASYDNKIHGIILDFLR